MLFKLAAMCRAFNGMMDGAGQDNGGSQRDNGPARQPPPVARTSITLIPGDPSRRVESCWQLPGDSPLVTSFPFVKWDVTSDSPPKAKVARSSLAGVLLLATQRPEASDFAKLDDLSFLASEVEVGPASGWAHQLDKVGAFDDVFKSLGEWKKHAAMLRGKVSPPELMRLKDDTFATSVAWSARAGPAELAFLARTTVDTLHTC